MSREHVYDDDEPVEPEEPSLEEIKKWSKVARDYAAKRVSDLPSTSILELLDAEYFTQELRDALNAVAHAADQAQRLYVIAEAKQSRDRAQKVIDSKTELIKTLEASAT